MGQTEEAPPESEFPERDLRLEAGIGLAQRKRAAVELIRRHETALRSSSRRYSICADDADDAYQRGIEILLSKAPVTDVRQLLPWARTVIKHEALAIRKTRERTLGRPASAYRDDESEDWVNLIPSASDGPDERAVKREKVARSREALSRLKPQELKALTMLAEGYSYAEIGEINRWTRTKVNRCLAEGRQRFRAVFSDSEAGDLCGEFEPLISTCCDGEIASDQLTRLQDHLATCGHCRATLRAYRAVPRAAAALLPIAPASQSFWDRIQEGLVTAQLKLQGLGRGSDASSVTSVAASGGTRGLGAAALAKIATVCVGTAGGAAACVATGVVPAPAILQDQNERPAISRPADRPQPGIVTDQVPSPVPTATAPNASPQLTKEPETQEQDQRSTPEPAPEPTPTEAEFTAEVAGTPVTTAAPPPPPAPAPGSVPVGGGGGEFGP